MACFTASMGQRSPREGSTAGGRIFCDLAERIIPAGAGQTAQYAVDNLKAEDHPRGCGANLLTPGDVKTKEGSSPRVRGKLSEPSNTHRPMRIIPAGAGQTLHPDINKAS
mgnify:CR=1 FL=1